MGWEGIRSLRAFFQFWAFGLSNGGARVAAVYKAGRAKPIARGMNKGMSKNSPLHSLVFFGHGRCDFLQHFVGNIFETAVWFHLLSHFVSSEVIFCCDGLRAQSHASHDGHLCQNALEECSPRELTSASPSVAKVMIFVQNKKDRVPALDVVCCH